MNSVCRWLWGTALVFSACVATVGYAADSPPAAAPAPAPAAPLPKTLAEHKSAMFTAMGKNDFITVRAEAKAVMDDPSASTGDIVQAQSQLAIVLERENKPADAVAAYQKIIDENGKNLDQPFAGAVRDAKMSLIRNLPRVNRKDDATALARAMFADKTFTDVPARRNLQWVFVGLMPADKPDDIIRECVVLLTSYPFDTNITAGAVQAIRKQLPSWFSAFKPKDEQINSLLALLRSQLTTNANDSRYCEIVQAAIVDVYLNQGNYETAMSEGKMLVEACTSADGMKDAVGQLTMAFKASDGNLARVNQFLEYQKFGKAGPDGKLGTEDDLTNPLDSVKPPTFADRDKLFQDGIAAQPRGWRGRLARATLYRYWGKPKEAIKELNIAYATCPVEKTSLQMVVDRTVDVLVLMSGDPNIGKKFVDYHKFGPNGPDGKPGTADDLENPMLKYLQ